MFADANSASRFRGRRVLVIGASGFVGRWVAQDLSRSGAQLWLVVRDVEAMYSIAASLGIRGEIVAADLGHQKALPLLFAKVQPEITFHLAGYGVTPGENDPQCAQAMNVELVKGVAEAVAALPPVDWPGLRLVHTGSTAEYGPVKGLVKEDSPTRPESLYGETKLAGTLALKTVVSRSGLRAVVARLFTVYGPGESEGRLLPSLLAAAKSGERLQLTSGEQQRDFTYVGDVAAGLLRLACVQESAPTIVNLATGQLTRVRDFVTQAAEILGLRPEQLHLGALAQRAHDLHQGPADVSRLEHLTGWRPRTTPAEGIRRTTDLEHELASTRTHSA